MLRQSLQFDPLALGVDEAVAASSTIGTIMAVLVFAACGIYQLTR